MILKQLVLGPFETNCYIVGSESNKEGMIIDPAASAKEILESVNNLGLDIKFIILTHGHMDHIGALAEVRQATGAELCVHPDDAKSIQEHPLRGGDSIDIGDIHFLVLHTPGHSPGGICLLGQGVVFCGDTLFNYSIGRTDLPGGSYSQLMNSIHTKLMVLPDNTVVYPGHGPDTTIGAERRANPFLRG